VITLYLLSVCRYPPWPPWPLQLFPGAFMCPNAVVCSWSRQNTRIGWSLSRTMLVESRFRGLCQVWVWSGGSRHSHKTIIGPCSNQRLASEYCFGLFPVVCKLRAEDYSSFWLACPVEQDEDHGKAGINRCRPEYGRRSRKSSRPSQSSCLWGRRSLR
jgi:hypothetical protein